jgi:hypothetical protein
VARNFRLVGQASTHVDFFVGSSSSHRLNPPVPA